MPETPAVSVLMPVHNAERYLRRAIESILAQTLADFEFLIVDDGSSDSSAEIINSYADPRIRYHKNEINLGIASSLNSGLDSAQGKYVARMDADDISVPHRLERQAAVLESQPDVDLVCSWIEVIDESGQTVFVQRRPNAALYYNLTFRCDIAHPTVMVRRTAILNAGKYDVTTRSEDYALWSKMVRRHKLLKIDEPLLSHRAHPASETNVYQSEFAEATRSIVRGNIIYLLGADTSLPNSFIDCYMGDCRSLLAERSPAQARECLQLLLRINACLEQRENPNRNVAHIRAAASVMLSVLLMTFLKNLNPFVVFNLAYQTGTAGCLIRALSRRAPSRLARLAFH